MNRFTNTLLQLAALLLFIGLSAGTASAQNFAAPGGIAYFGDASCTNPVIPCSLGAAVEDATDAGVNGNTIFVRLPQVGGTVVFVEDLVGAQRINAPIVMDTYVAGPTTGVAGTVRINGDVIVGTNDGVTLAANLRLELVGQPGTLQMRDNAFFNGFGTLAFPDNTGQHTIQLGDPTAGCVGAAPKIAFFRNVEIDKIGGSVDVFDQCQTDLNQSDLFITNRIDVLNGTLALDDNNLHIVSSDTPDAGVNIANGGVIDGDGTFFISVVPAAAGAIGFDNTLVDAFLITGGGFLNMAFTKNTDAGVRVAGLTDLGAGGTSFNRAGALYVEDATNFNGTFRNESSVIDSDLVGGLDGARTEFWNLKTITENLEVMGPGNEVFPGECPGPGCTCETGNLFTGDEAGVYFFAAVTVEDEKILDNTDDPVTPCIEGVWFMGDPNPGIQGPPVAAAKNQTHQPFSTIKKKFTSSGVSGVFLDAPAGGFVHNVAYEGDFAFATSPEFKLVVPADPFFSQTLCATYSNEANGNKVLFTGGAAQNLLFNTLLDIQSVQIAKNATGQSVTINGASTDVFTVDTGLEVLRGNFITNGLLDLNSTIDKELGGTVVINRDAAGDGVLSTGAAAEAYAVAGTFSSGPENLPRKIKYTGSTAHFTGAEIPGTASGSLGFATVTLQEFEVFMADVTPTPIITTSKDFTLADRLRIARGNLQVGSADITLLNKLQIGMGDGNILPPQAGGGDLIFPMVTDANTNNNGIDLSYFGTKSNRVVSYEWPNASTENGQNVIRNVEVGPECGAARLTVQLRAGEDFRANPDDTADDADTQNGQAGFYIWNLGQLDINGNTLEINAANGQDNTLYVDDAPDGLTDSTDPQLASAAATSAKREAVSEALKGLREAVRAADGDQAEAAQALAASLASYREVASKSLAHAGLLKYIGGSDTQTFINTAAGGLRFNFPAIEVSKGDTGHAEFDANGVPATTVPPVPANNADILGTPHFTLTDAALGLGTLTIPDAGGVLLEDGLDILDVFGNYYQFDGEFEMVGLSSIAPGIQPYEQLVKVGGNFVEDNGEFFSDGGDVEVSGDFLVGDFIDAAGAMRAVPLPGDALFSLLADGELTVTGDFYVGPNTEDTENPLDVTRRNRFFLGTGSAFLFGDYTNDGTGDRHDDQVFLLESQGLDGTIFFVGNSQQNVRHRQDEDVYFNNVVVAGEGGLQLLDNAWQNDTGWIRLELGIIETQNEIWNWIILNSGFENRLFNTNNSPACNDPLAFIPPGPACFSVVDLGSRDSFVNGQVLRNVEFGNATGGVISGGYLFPVGSTGDPRTVGTGGRDVNYFRPLILQFPNDLGRSSIARVDYLQNATNADFTLPAAGLEVDDDGGETLILDVVGHQFWKLEFDEIPSFDPNVRVEAASLPNIFDIKKLRLVQWDCDGTNPRLAGLYDVDRDPIDDASAVLNDFIDGIPNLTQEGVEVEGCQVIGIASNSAINRIDIPRANGFARVQIIHNSPNAGPVDIYLNDVRVLDDFAFQTATPFVSIPIGATKVDVVAGADANNSNPVATTNVNLVRNVAYVVAASGDVGKNFTVLTQADVRLAASSAGQVEFFTMHGAPDIGAVDLRILDPVTNNTVVGLIANNIDFSDIRSYFSLVPDGYNIQVTNADNSVEYEVFRFDFNALGGDTFTFLASGSGSKNAQGFTLIGFDINGNPIRPQLITDTEDEAEVPNAFAIDGNYPNPFNPTTTLQFDLPETAQVSIQVIDLLGRQVMTVAPQMVEAGANRTLQLDAASLASGTYIYRVVAQTATDTMVKTGRMTLVK